MIDLEKTYEYKENKYSRISYKYDKKTDISITIDNSGDEPFKYIKIINRGIQRIPHSVDVISTDNPNEIDIMIHFDTPVYLDEIEEIKNIFLYYETLKGYINQHLNDF